MTRDTAAAAVVPGVGRRNSLQTHGITQQCSGRCFGFSACAIAGGCRNSHSNARCAAGWRHRLAPDGEYAVNMQDREGQTTVWKWTEWRFRDQAQNEVALVLSALPHGGGRRGYLCVMSPATPSAVSSLSVAYQFEKSDPQAALAPTWEVHQQAACAAPLAALAAEAE